MSSKVSIWYEGWISSPEKGVTLTGSSNLVTVDYKWKPYRVLIDYGMFQWWKGDEEFNKQTLPIASQIDAVIMTHSHVDHIGRLPLLVKSWFKGKIYITELAAKVWKHMLDDYVSFTRANIEDNQMLRKRLSKKLNEALKIINLSNQLEENGLAKEERKTIEKKLLGLVGNKSDLEAYKDAEDILLDHWVESQKDLAGALPSVPPLLYNEHDIKRTLEQVEYLEPWDEILLESSLIVKNLNEPIIDEYLNKVSAGFTAPMFVPRELKASISQRWKKQFEQEKEVITSNIQKNHTIEQNNETRTHLLEWKINSVQWYEIFSVKDVFNDDLLNTYKSVVSSISIDTVEESISNYELIELSWQKCSSESVHRSLKYAWTDFYWNLEDLQNEFLNLPEEIDKYKEIYQREKQNLSLAFAGREFWDFFRKLEFVENDSDADIVYTSEMSYEALVNELSKKEDSNDESVKLKITGISWAELKKNLQKSNKENISQERKVSNLLKEIQKLEQRFKFLELYKLIFWEYSNFKTTEDIKSHIESSVKSLHLFRADKEKYKEAEDYIALIMKRRAEYPEYEKSKNELTELWIESNADIETVLEKKLPVEFDYQKLDKALSQLHVNTWLDSNNLIQAIKLRFLNAGHIEWSVSALLSFVTHKVNDVLNYKKSYKHSHQVAVSHKNFLFSGDLGRIRDPNLCGVPEVADCKLDYVQVESTYAGRLHPDKQASINALVSEIDTTKGKSILPVFSQSRSQEMAIILLTEMQKSLGFNAKLFEDIKKIKEQKEYLVSDMAAYADEAIEGDFEVDPEEIVGFETQIRICDSKIKRLQGQIVDYDIYVDSPLWDKITEEYLDMKYENYKLLDPEYQQEIFGREVVKVFDKNNIIGFYDKESKGRKQVVLASSWMVEGWAILSHLDYVLPDENNKIIFVGYTPMNWRAGDIKRGGMVQLPSSQDPVRVRCEVADIAGFSSHIDHDEILEYLGAHNFARGARIILNHWWESREILKKDIESEIIKSKKLIKVIIPDLWAVYHRDFARSRSRLTKVK